MALSTAVLTASNLAALSGVGSAARRESVWAPWLVVKKAGDWVALMVGC